MHLVLETSCYASVHKFGNIMHCYSNKVEGLGWIPVSSGIHTRILHHSYYIQQHQPMPHDSTHSRICCVYLSSGRSNLYTM